MALRAAEARPVADRYPSGSMDLRGSARSGWSLHPAYVASPPDPASEHAFLALDRLTVQRVVGWLTELRAEKALATGDVEQQARFLVTVVNGLALERALPQG